MNRQITLFYGRTPTTACLIYLLPLIVIHYYVMYTITVVLQYKRGAEMDKEEVMAKVEKMPVEEKYKLLPVTDQAYIRGFIDRSVVEQMKVGAKKPPFRNKNARRRNNENR
jgi:hypothetical protein